MNRRIAGILLLAATGFAVARAADTPVAVPSPGAPAAVGKSQTLCPVMGGAIDTNSFVDVKGRRIYVCCAGCIPTIQKDPDKYLVILAKEGVEAPRVQTVCPVMNKPVDRTLFVDAGGKRLYVCCEACVKIAGQSPAKYMAKAEAGGVVLDRAPAEARP